MASKKLKKAIMAGLAGYAGAKLLGSKTSTANVNSGKGGTSSSAFSRAKANSSYKDSIMKGGKASKMIKARGGKMVNLKPTKLY